VVTTQTPASLLQQAPLGQGLGEQVMPTNHWPLQAVLLATRVHPPVGRQHAPVMLGQGFGVQEILPCQLPQQQARVVTVQPTGSAGQAVFTPAAVVVVPMLVQAVETQHAPTAGQFTAEQA
jgi:hypothetical protein